MGGLGRLATAVVRDESDRETSGSELVAVPNCHAGVPNRYASEAPCSAITIAIQNSSLGRFHKQTRVSSGER